MSLEGEASIDEIWASMNATQSYEVPKKSSIDKCPHDRQPSNPQAHPPVQEKSRQYSSIEDAMSVLPLGSTRQKVGALQYVFERLNSAISEGEDAGAAKSAEVITIVQTSIKDVLKRAADKVERCRALAIEILKK